MITQYILPGVIILIAGAMEAVMDKLSFHNYYDNYFWGFNSWKNKYKDRDPAHGQTFKGRYFTFLCDGFHLCKLWQHLCIFSCIGVLVSLNYENYNWWHFVIVGISFWAINRIGFNIIWKLFK